MRKKSHNIWYPFKNTATSKKVLDSDDADDETEKRERVSEARETVISSSDEDGKVGEVAINLSNTFST